MTTSSQLQFDARSDADASDPIDALCEHAYRVRYQDLPPEAIEHQKRRIIDNLAALLAGMREPGCIQYLRLVERERGCAEATVLGHGSKTTLRNAAVTNSIMARALDYCDVLAPGYHPSSTDVPLGIGVAEAFGRSGKDMLVALAVGQDVAQRINLAAQATGWMYSGFDPNILGNLGGAIIAARLMGCTPEQMRNAVGLAFNAGAGSIQMYQDKILGVRIAQGNATRNALEAALLAAADVTGIRSVLGGENGFFRVYARREPEWSLLSKDLGVRFKGRDETCFKPYPCCGVLMALVDGGLSLITQQGLNAGEIESMHVRMSTTARILCGQPFVPTVSPQSSAMFSVQYVLASVLLRRSCRLEHFQPARILEPEVLELASRVYVEENNLEPRFDAFDIRVKLNGERDVQARSSIGAGWPEKPLSNDQLTRKLSQCLEFSGFAQPDARAADIVGEVMRLEDARDVTGLIGKCVL